MVSLFRQKKAFMASSVSMDSAAFNALEAKDSKQHLPRRFDGLEVWLLMFCGIYGLLVSAFVLKGSRDIKFMCIAFVLMGAVRRLHPSRKRWHWTADGVLAVVLVAAIFAIPSSGGSTGPFLHLLLVLVMGYPLMMEASVAFAFAAFSVAVYFLTGLGAGQTTSMPLYIATGGFIAGICLVSARFGYVLRSAEEVAESLRRDKASLAYNEHGLARYGGKMLASCMREQKPCSLVLLHMPPDWREMLRRVDHSERSSAWSAYALECAALRDMAVGLMRVLPAHSVVARNADGNWVLLVPQLEREAVLDLLTKSLGRPLQLPFGEATHEMFVALTPCVVVAESEHDSVHLMQHRAQEIWRRGLRSGVV